MYKILLYAKQTKICPISVPAKGVTSRSLLLSGEIGCGHVWMKWRNVVKYKILSKMTVLTTKYSQLNMKINKTKFFKEIKKNLLQILRKPLTLHDFSMHIKLLTTTFIYLKNTWEITTPRFSDFFEIKFR